MPQQSTAASDLPETNKADPAPIVAVVQDLLFVSRLRGLATSAGVQLVVIRRPSDLTPTHHARRVLIDLNLNGALEAATAWASTTGRPVAGFVSHVDVDTIRLARSAGVEPVIPRSRIATVLPAWLQAS